MNGHRNLSLAVALAGAVAVAASIMFVENAAARALLPVALLVLLGGLAYAAAGGPGVMRVGAAMFRRTLLTYLSYRAQLVAILAWTTLTVLILVTAGATVLRILIPSLSALGEDEAFPRRFVAILVLGFTTWPVFWKSWEVTTLGVRTEQWEGTFEPLVPMPNGVRALPFGYLISRVPYTVFFQMVVLGALVFAMPEGALLLDRPRVALDFAAVMATTIVCMWGLGLLFGGLAILYKRMGPVDLVVRTLFIFLAGVFVPLEIFPSWAQTFAQVLPVTHAYKLLQATAVDGIPLGELQGSLTALLAFTVLAVVAGNLVYHHFAEKARRDGAIQGY